MLLLSNPRRPRPSSSPTSSPATRSSPFSPKPSTSAMQKMARWTSSRTWSSRATTAAWRVCTRRHSKHSVTSGSCSCTRVRMWAPCACGCTHWKMLQSVRRCVCVCLCVFACVCVHVGTVRSWLHALEDVAERAQVFCVCVHVYMCACVYV